MSRNHVFHGGLKHIIFHHLVGQCPQFDNPFSDCDISLHCGEMGEKVGKSRI